MAIFDVQLNAISRSDGRSATAAAAYRAGIKIHDERTSVSHDYSRKQGVLGNHLVMPSSSTWQPSAAELWNAAELAENRKNSCVAKEWRIAFPAELTKAENEALGLKMATAIIERYQVAGMLSIHAPSREGDQRNLHAHFLMSDRIVAGEGFGAKNRVLTDMKTGPAETKWLRETWATLVNAALAEANQTARVDHRSRKEQGLEGPAMRHLGPAATAMERRGIVTELGEQNRAVAQHRAEILLFPQRVQTVATPASLAIEIAQTEAVIFDLAKERERLQAADDARREKLADPVELLNSLAAAIADAQTDWDNASRNAAPTAPADLPGFKDWARMQPIPTSNNRRSLRERQAALKRAEDREKAAAAEVAKVPALFRFLPFGKIGAARRNLEAARIETRRRKASYKRGLRWAKENAKALKAEYNAAVAEVKKQQEAAVQAKTRTEAKAQNLAKAKARFQKELKRFRGALNAAQIARLSVGVRLAYQAQPNTLELPQNAFAVGR